MCDEVDVAPGGLRHGGDVLALALDRVAGSLVAAQAPAAAVDEVEAVAPGELLADRRPAGVVRAGAVDEHHRRAVAQRLEPDDRAVG